MDRRQLRGFGGVQTCRAGYSGVRNQACAARANPMIVLATGPVAKRAPICSPLCAPCKGADLQWVQFPPGKRSLQPVAIGAAVEVTILPKPSMERTVQRFREQAGRNASERRAGLEKANVGADPAKGWGRPPSQVPSGDRHQPLLWPHRGNGDGMSAQGDRAQHGKPPAVGDGTPNRMPARDRPGCRRCR